MSANMSPAKAHEQARDSADCLLDGRKTIQRIARHFPEFAEQIGQVVRHIDQAHALIGTVSSGLDALPEG